MTIAPPPHPVERRYPWYAHPTSISKSMLLRCDNCHYSLRGLPRTGVCPECGQAYDKKNALLPPRRVWTAKAVVVWVGWPLWISLLVVGIGAAVFALGGNSLYWNLTTAITVCLCLAAAPLNFIVQLVLVHPRTVGYNCSYADGLRGMSAGAVACWQILGFVELGVPLLLVLWLMVRR